MHDVGVHVDAMHCTHLTSMHRCMHAWECGTPDGTHLALGIIYHAA